MGLGKRRKLALLSTSRKIERRRFHEFNRTRESQQWRCRFLSRVTTTPSRIVRLRTTFSSSTRSVGRSRFRAKRSRFFSRKSRWPIPARDTWPSLATRYSKIFAAERARLRVAVRDDHEEDWTFVGCSFDSREKQDYGATHAHTYSSTLLTLAQFLAR